MPPVSRITGPGLLILILTLLSTAVPGGQRYAHAAENTLISFKIKDQFNHLHTDARYRGAVIVITWGDRKGSSYIKNWSPALDDSLASEIRSYRLHHIEVAHVKGVPFFLKGKVKGYFSKEPTEWVLLDWDGKFNQAYDCTSDHCNVLVFARDGELKRQWAVTEADSAVLAEMVVEIRSHLVAAETE